MKKFMSLVSVFLLSSGLLVGCSGEQSTEGGNKEISQEIVVVTREDGSGTRGAFVELTGIEEKSADGSRVDKTTKEAITQMKTDTVLTTVSGDKNAIGYVSTGSLNDTVKALKVDGVEPSVENIKSGKYKIARPFIIAMKQDKEKEELIKDFKDFIMSKEGQEVVSKSYISVEDNAKAFTGTKPKGKIVVAGSSSVTPVMEKLKEAYEKVNPNANIEVQQSDSSSGMKAAIDGTADIGMASRDLKESEKAELKYTSIALDGIAVIANTDNKVEDLTTENIKSIFIGETVKWDQVK